MDKITDKVNFGRFFERACADWLKEQDYDILEHNYTVRGGEIDIIARDDTTLVFIEVKARRDGDNIRRFGRPSAAVDKTKQSRIINASREYLKTHSGFFGVRKRFDVIEVYYEDYGSAVALRFLHIKSAFIKGR